MQSSAHGPDFSLSNPPVKILVVDDEESILWSLSQNLTMANDSYCVGTAASAEEALSLIDKTGVDILVTDFKLPNMSGLGLIESVKENSPETRSILMTAYGSTEVMSKANARGSFAYLEKPFTIEQLLHYISDSAQELRRARVQAQLQDIDIAQLLYLYALQESSAHLRIESPNGVGKILFDKGTLQFAEFGGIRGPEALVIALSAATQVDQKNITSSFLADVGEKDRLSLDRKSISRLLEAETPLEQLKVIIDAQRAANGLDVDRSHSAVDILRPRAEKRSAPVAPKVVIGSAREETQSEAKAFKAFEADELVLQPEEKSASEAASADMDDFSYRQLLLQSGRLPDAQSEPKKREDNKKLAGSLVNRGVRHFKLHQLEQARACWQQAIEIDPDCGPARRNLKILDSLKSPKTC